MKTLPEKAVLNVLNGLDAEAGRAVALRTRRAVREATERMREARARRRRNTGWTLLAVLALLIFLTPAVWAVCEDLFSGEAWMGAPAVTALLAVTAASTLAAVLLAERGRARGNQAR